RTSAPWALRPGPGGWAQVVDEQVTAIDAQIARAQRAREVLVAGRDCPGGAGTRLQVPPGCAARADRR
ncbi:hypothetical protein, partial [Pseudonocardia sp.]|uniref:hypothetical protein n=1 Tax=Pseudonocardia sp. TaxID=60912 RepID=UPI0031FC28D1